MSGVIILTNHSDLDLDFKVMVRQACPICLLREHVIYAISNQSVKLYLQASDLDLDFKVTPSSLSNSLEILA